MEATHEETLPEACVTSPTALQRLVAWLSLPDGDRAELLGGRIVYKAMPSIEHGDAILGIAEQLGRFRGPLTVDGGGWWLSQEVDLYLGGEGVRPDLVGWRIEKHPTPPRKVNVGERHLGVYVTPPDWVCEVLSESTRDRDEANGLKWRAHFEARVEHYWLVDLMRGQVTVYRSGERDYESVTIVGRESEKPLPPFSAKEFHARRVFLLADLTRKT